MLIWHWVVHGPWLSLFFQKKKERKTHIYVLIDEHAAVCIEVEVIIIEKIYQEVVNKHSPIL